jgi:hypothetical protein
VSEQIQRYVRVGLYRVFEGFGGLLCISSLAERPKGARVSPLGKDVFFVTLATTAVDVMDFLVGFSSGFMKLQVPAARSITACWIGEKPIEWPRSRSGWNVGLIVTKVRKA